MASQIGITCTDARYQRQAQEVAARLKLDPIDSAAGELLLQIGSDGISLQRTSSRQHPLRVDFMAPRLRYRRQQANPRSEMLARAIGLRSLNPSLLVDATAGLGRDSFIMAALGCRVKMLERSSVMALLLADGLDRAAKVPELEAIIARMDLIQIDAVSYLQNTCLPPGSVVYLDPMFPVSNSSALPAGEMQILQMLLGSNDDLEDLYRAACKSQPERIVIKRPRKAPSGLSKPTFSLVGKAHRFDVYQSPGFRPVN